MKFRPGRRNHPRGLPSAGHAALPHLARDWLSNPNGDWHTGLDIAEVAANLLESAQLVPLRELPTCQIEVLRRGQEDRPALRALLEKDIAVLEPYRR